MALINSIVKYRDLGVSGTVKIWCAVYRDTEKNCPSLKHSTIGVSEGVSE